MHSEPTYTPAQVLRACRKECWSCGAPCGKYMVHNRVWKAAWPDGEPSRTVLARLATRLYPDRQRSVHSGRVLVFINLCLACLELQLKRPLTIDDFQLRASHGGLLPINEGIFLGYRLGQKDAKKAMESGNKKDEGG